MKMHIRLAMSGTHSFCWKDSLFTAILFWNRQYENKE
jgi:hypothetical protein